jgi:hypothetical protein
MILGSSLNYRKSCFIFLDTFRHASLISKHDTRRTKAVVGYTNLLRVQRATTDVLSVGISVIKQTYTNQKMPRNGADRQSPKVANARDIEERNKSLQCHNSAF